MTRIASALSCASWGLVMATLAFSGCEQQEGFLCGRTVPGTSKVRTCDRAGEVCVCATNSCARKVGIFPDVGDAGAPAAGAASRATDPDIDGECLGEDETGFRYVEAPFAREELAGDCVKRIDFALDAVVSTSSPKGAGCPGQVEPNTGSGGTTPVGGSGGMSGGGAAGVSGMTDGGSSGMSDGGMSGGSGDAGAAGLGGAGGGGGVVDSSGAGGT